MRLMSETAKTNQTESTSPKIKTNLHIVYVTMEYIDPVTKKIIDGGLANYLHKITTALVKQKHDVTVIVVNSKKECKITENGVKIVYINTFYKKNRLYKILRHVCPFKFAKKETYFWDCINKAIKKINKKQKIDIIQYASCIGIGCYPQKNIPSCLRISSYAKLWQKYYSINNPEEIELEQKEYKNSRFIFGPSEHIAQYIKQDLNLNKNIKIIESPYPDELKNEDESILNELKSAVNNSPYLLFFGTIGELKGCKVIADCIYDILKKYPDLYLVLVGKNLIINNIDYAELIKEKSKEFKNRIIRYPSLAHEALYPIIKNSFGVLMPSLTENFSNACTEAMRLKKIVIGTEGNFSQLITDGKNGFLSKTGDSESLKSKIIELMQLSSSEKIQMEQKAYERCETLSLQNICNQHLDYYEYVIKHWEDNNGKH